MIVASAIKHGDVVYVGKRHSEVIARMAADFGVRATLNDGDVTGFVTGDLRFLTRSEAAKHAVACGQIVGPHDGKLTSDELWPE